MKRFVSSLLFLICTVTSIYGQTYLDNLQKKVQGEGNVTVNQSKTIDDLVNGTISHTAVNQTYKSPKTHSPISEHQKEKDKVTERNNKETHQIKENIIHEQEIRRQNEEEKKTEHEQKKTEAEVNKTEAESEDIVIPSVDMSKKVMRGSYKVTGYRIQAFAGGNSRKDRLQAESIGKAIKMRYPSQPVYVHFYSPRWICRIGNYRELSEARTYLRRIRDMGYKSACLVKGRITVQK
nr:SPOR domain-containing protein [Prevotella sp.]